LGGAEDCLEAAPARRVAFDECTVRMMFIEMDANGNGTVTKEEFINFIRSQPQLQNVMYNGLKPEEACEQGESRPSPQAARAVGIKRIIALYKDIDKNKNGVATWDEFIDFFRRTGLLLIYSTPDNPRDRMAASLADEYQRRVAVGKWQSGGQKLGVGQRKGWDQLMECQNSKFLKDQEQQRLTTQWAGKKLVQLQEQSARGGDALSIVQDSVETMKQSARMVVGSSAKKNVKSVIIDEQPDSMLQAIVEPPVKKTEKSVAINDQADATPMVPQGNVHSADPAISVSTEASGPHAGQKLTLNLPVSESEHTITEQASPLSPPLKLPTLLKLPIGTHCKSPMRRKGRSKSTVCQTTSSEHQSGTEQKIQNTSPRKTPRHHKRKGDSASPSKRGRTPRRRAERALTTSLLCQ
jgi:hypothetical protein